MRDQFLSMSQALAGDLWFFLLDVLPSFRQITLEPLQPLLQFLLEEFRLVGLDLSGQRCGRLQSAASAELLGFHKSACLPNTLRLTPSPFLCNPVAKGKPIVRQLRTSPCEFDRLPRQMPEFVVRLLLSPHSESSSNVSQQALHGLVIRIRHVQQETCGIANSSLLDQERRFVTNRRIK